MTDKAGISPAQFPGECSRLSPNQIVYLVLDQVCLYGEVIQVVESRDRCWVRPLAIVDADSGGESNNTCHQTPQGPDVIWPLSWFKPALDTDWLAVLSRLSQAPSYDRSTANQRLRQLWQIAASRS
ncbi:MAG: hypothetical protein HC812_06535 [Leptolyngbya sp. RL_3_1]|nr:hypothetical protein [Leptolyngbya sp. RL_3_1]